MPGLRDFLSRFRPAGTPGAAARPGVPVDRVAEREAELQPVLALLADTEQEAARIRCAAAEQAQQRRETARRQAEAILADARLRRTRCGLKPRPTPPALRLLSGHRSPRQPRSG